MLIGILKNWKLIVTGVVLAVLLGAIYMYKSSADSYKKDAETLRIKNGQLQEQLEGAIRVNKENLETLVQIQKDNKIKDSVIASLQTELNKNRISMQDLRDQILKSKPEDDGPVSNVLKNTIRGVQDVQ